MHKLFFILQNDDGQPLLYFLLDMLLTITNDHRLLSVIKQLICQVKQESDIHHIYIFFKILG